MKMKCVPDIELEKDFKHRNLESIKVGTKREKQLLTKGKRLKVVSTGKTHTETE